MAMARPRTSGASGRVRRAAARDVPLPSLFVIGAPKCGTTSLHALLTGLDGLVPCAVKEPNFFEHLPNFSRGLQAYSSLFPWVDGAGIGFEATPWYLYSAVAAERIRTSVGPHVRVIVCVRHPLDRAVSMYRDRVGSGWEQRPFREAFIQDLEDIERRGPVFEGRLTSCLSGGFYRQALQPWIDTFGCDAIRIFDLSQVRDAPDRVVAEIGDWLGVAVPDGPRSVAAVHANPASATRWPAASSLVGRLGSGPVGTTLRRVLPWRLYAELGRAWRAVSTADDAAIGVGADDRRWLASRAWPLYRDQERLLREVGLTPSARWEDGP